MTDRAIAKHWCYQHNAANVTSVRIAILIFMFQNSGLASVPISISSARHDQWPCHPARAAELAGRAREFKEKLNLLK